MTRSPHGAANSPERCTGKKSNLLFELDQLRARSNLQLVDVRSPSSARFSGLGVRSPYSGPRFFQAEHHQTRMDDANEWYFNSPLCDNRNCPALVDGLGLRRVCSGDHVSFRICSAHRCVSAANASEAMPLVRTLRAISISSAASISAKRASREDVAVLPPLPRG
jgi:hypothetical protein